MKQFFISLIFAFFLCGSSVFAADEQAVKPSSDDKPPLALRGADIKEVSRLVFDGIPQNRYRVVPLNNQLNIIFEDFEYSFIKNDLLAIRLLKNIKKLTVTQKDNFTILNIAYKCECQADFYKWHNQKLVLDVFSLSAVTNPLRINKQAKVESEPKKKITEPSEKKVEKLQKEKKEEISKNFENYLKNLIQTANENGLVEFKDAVKDKFQQQTDDPVADIILNQAVPKVIAVNKTQNNNIQETIKNVHISDKNILSPSDTEKLLPTDKNMFLDNHGACLPDAAFKLPPNDPEYDTFYDKISDYRYNLIGEFDSVNSESALKLAYHYISYGLGEEALQVLSNFPTPEQRGHIAKSMAELLTNRKISDDSVFKNSDKCKGVQGLWAAYRYFKLGDEDRATKLSNFPNVTHFLKTFPIALQSQIGSSLALNLVRQNSYKTATKIIDVLATGKGQFDPYVLLVRGLIDAKNGLADRALNALENAVIKTNGVDQQMAGLALCELKLASGIPLTQQDVSILEEVVFLKSRELSGVQGLALIAENESRYKNFNVAFKRLSQKVYYNSQIKDPVDIKAEQLFKRIAVSGEGTDNPNTFSIYWDYPQLIPQKPVYLKAFADKLFDNGYDIATINVIDDIQEKFPNYTQKNDVTFLKAQAFFRQGEYRDAVKTMNSAYTNDVVYMRLKAEALHKLNKNLDAIALLDKFDDKDSVLSKARYALASREWESVSKDYEQAKQFAQDSEFYYRAKASAYMSGFQYPGTANQYKKSEDVVFHQPERQAKGVDSVVHETKKLIELIEQRSDKINNLLNTKISDEAKKG